MKLRKPGRPIAAIVIAVGTAGIVGVVAEAQNLTVKGTATSEGNGYFYQNVGIGTPVRSIFAPLLGHMTEVEA